MSEPRFLYEMSRGIIRDNGRELFPHKAVQLLNAFYNENRTLKGRLQEYEGILQSDTITDLETKIAKLKTEIDTYKAGNKTLHERLKTLHEENKDLKKQMKRLYNYFEDFFSEEMGNNDFSEMWDFVAEDEKWD